MRNLALVFSGQGSQYVGMGKWLCEKYKIAEDTFDEASNILNMNIKQICLEYNEDELSKTINSQIAIFTTSIAMYRAYMQEIGVIPQILAGHSLGEISALTCANAFSFCDGLKIVHNRASYMNEVCDRVNGGMIAITGIDRKVIENVCRNCSNVNEYLTISSYNTTNQTIVSGHKNLLGNLTNSLIEMGGSVRKLKVNGAFHSPIMYPAAYNLQQTLKEFNFKDFKWTVISNITGAPYKGKEDIIKNLTQQMIKPVQWIRTVNYLKEVGVNTVIELGPRPVLKNLIKAQMGEMNCYSFSIEKDITLLRQQINVKNITYIKKFIRKCIASVVATKNYTNNDSMEYQRAEMEFRKITDLLDELEKDKRLPSEEDIILAQSMLKNVFVAKGVPESMYQKRLNELICETGTAYIFDKYKIITN